MKCQVKHIGTCCKNKFTRLDQIIISHMVLSVNGFLYIVIDTMFSNGFWTKGIIVSYNRHLFYVKV